MNHLWQILDVTAKPGAAPAMLTVLGSLLLAFVLGQLIAWVYLWTHDGLSYSRSFTQSLVLMAVIVALVMIIVGNNIVTAFGLIGALALVRFRNVLKDTRDTVFVFSSLVVGLATGSQRYGPALMGTAALMLVAIYLHISGFGSLGRFDGFLRYRLPVGGEADEAVPRVMRAFCRNYRQISVRRFGANPMADYTYHIRLRDKQRGQDLVHEVQSLEGVQDVTLVLQEELSEV